MQISEEQYNKLPEELQKHFYKGNFHCTTKPVKLMEYLVRLVTPKEGICLDPFVGSGTTAIACLKNNRKFIGFELNPEYAKICMERVKPLMSQTKLTEVSADSSHN
jgi:site-specific DNA-methyltransferase (adenine-specific)